MEFRRLTNLLPRQTVRLRLTALYSTLFLASGMALLAITYALENHALNRKPLSGHGIPLVRAGAVHNGPNSPPVLIAKEHSADLHQLLVESSIALAVMVLASVLLGWVVAGRVLRPLRTITNTTRNISENNLHERLALSGPRDELTELGDTIDGLVGRLEGAFDSQRRFVANASHEMRTPLTVSRAMIQVALADPNVTLDSLRTACGDVLDAGKEQEQLIDALLILARSQRGLDHIEPVDLAAVTSEALRTHESVAAARGLHLDATVSDATISGDARLVHTLVSNLVDNAVRHNIVGGRIRVAVAASTAGATLIVTNTGPSIPPDQIEGLLQPFQRGRPDRTANSDGLGLGLSIVEAIVTAHGADLSLRPGNVGGLDVEVHFHRPPSDHANVTTRNGRHPKPERYTASL